MRELCWSSVLTLAIVGACGQTPADKQPPKIATVPAVRESPAGSTKAYAEVEAKAPATPKTTPEKPAPVAGEVALTEPTKPLAGFRYAHRACPACRKQEATTCLRRTHPDGRVEELGCGSASPIGTYAVVRRETGSIEDETWVLDYIYHGPKGVLSTIEEACTGSPGFYCNSPGRLLALGDGAWIQHMSNAGDGTNDQSIANLVSGKRFALPDGEYSLLEHPAGILVGLLATEPNIYDEHGEAFMKVTLGCFDTQLAKAHILWSKQVPEDAGDIYLGADLKWKETTLEIRSDENKLLKTGSCPSANSGS